MIKRDFTKYVTALIVIVPIIVLLCGFYFYFYGSMKKKVYATANDIQYIVQNIHDTFFGKKYGELNADTIVHNNILPFSIEPIETPLGYQIRNRFGGKMFFYEAFSRIEERTMYFTMYNDPEKYKKYYKGYGAYIILLTNLMKRECVMLSRVNWRKFMPNFLGMEVSAAKPTAPYNGVYNLKHYLLIDNLGEQYSTKDEGILTRRSLSVDDAEKACDCHWRTCMIALKFL